VARASRQVRRVQGADQRALSAGELLGGLLAALAAWRFGYSGALAGALVYCWALIALTFIDFDTQLLPDDITLPLLWLGLALNVFGLYTDLRSAVLGAISGISCSGGVLALPPGRGKEGMGYGDFKLLAASAPGPDGRCCPS